MSDWKRIKAEYIAGGTSYRKLAQKYSVSFSTLRKVAAKEQWTELRNNARTKADTKFVEAISDVEAQKSIDIVSVADKLLKQIEDMLTTSPITSAQSLKNITSALKDLKEIKGCKSDADMREQEARIAKLRKEAEREDDNVNEIEIVFNAGPEEWNG